MKMSIQMAKAIMMAFQKAIAEQVDIMEVFDTFKIVDTDDGLVVSNPPTFVAKVKEECECGGECGGCCKE